MVEGTDTRGGSLTIQPSLKQYEFDKRRVEDFDDILGITQ